MLNKIKDRLKDHLRLSGFGFYKIPKYARRDHHFKYLYFRHLFDSIKNIEGDIVECGVGLGTTLSILIGLRNEEGRNRRIIGFDSFEGFPEPSENDKSVRNTTKGDWSEAAEAVVRRTIRDNGLTEERVKLVKGFFEDTVSKYQGKIALLHLDVDLYGSYKTCLENLYPKVQGGGVVMFDEYENSKIVFPGASKAIDEYLGTETQKIKISTFVNRAYFIKS